MICENIRWQIELNESLNTKSPLIRGVGTHVTVNMNANSTNTTIITLGAL